MNNYENKEFVKAFVGKMLRDVSSRLTTKRVLKDAFRKSLKTVNDDHNEAEAIQRLNLHKAFTIGKHLLWLVEWMIELRVANVVVRELGEQKAFTDDL
ncbi:hypothetical protein RYX36_016585 [Vicia faba]